MRREDNIAVTEHPDVVRPVFEDCFINYATGDVTLYTSEILDITPSSSTVVLTKLILVNESGNVPVLNPQVGAPTISTFPDFGPASNAATTMALGNITDVDDLRLNITIPELARSLVVQFGGTVPNGDSGATLLDASVGAVQDVAGNLNFISAGLVCREEHDLILPTMESGAINFGTGVLVLTFSEIVSSVLAWLE